MHNLFHTLFSHSTKPEKCFSQTQYYYVQISLNLFENTHSKRQIKFVSLVNITVWLLKQPQLSAFNLISDLIILHVMFHRIPDIHYKHIDSLRVSQMTNSDVKRQNPLLNKGQVRLFILSRDWKESLWDFPHANKIIPSY